MLEKINKLRNWQPVFIIVVVGFAVFSIGLSNQFLGDDSSQIVNNPPVHSITNVRLFFEGGTFYDGNSLIGVYFRPLMTTVFSLLYTLFGPHPIYFHLLQLIICIASTAILYLVFRYSFRPVLALFLSLVFLVHPMNSQIVYVIASMQDALFFFFGILALYLLLRLGSIKSLLAVALCLLLSLLSKESGVLFIAMALLYLFWFDQRKRLYSFMGIIVLPTALYLALKIHAVGLLGANPNNAPIDSLSLADRLLTAPSILLFYITKFLLPLHLAHAYYWVHPNFSVRYFLLPLIIDLVVVAFIVYAGLLVRRKAAKAQFYTFLFFTAWSTLGTALLLQIIPLDMTASEAWFYFPIAGVLGMVGVVATTLLRAVQFDRRILIIICVLLIGLLGVRTAIRGTNWSSITTLAYNDIKVSKEDFNSANIIATDLNSRGRSSEAKAYALRSIHIYPYGISYETLGFINYSLGDYPQSIQAYTDGLKLRNNQQLTQRLYENASRVMLWSGDPNDNIKFIESALSKYPQDADLWLDLAVLEYKNGNSMSAKQAISQAYNYNQSNEIVSVYTVIMNDERLILNPPQ